MTGYDSTQPLPNAVLDALPEMTRSARLLARILDAPEPFRSLILMELDKLSDEERREKIANMATLLDCFESGDKAGFTAQMESAGYGMASDMVWEQLQVLWGKK